MRKNYERSKFTSIVSPNCYSFFLSAQRCVFLNNNNKNNNSSSNSTKKSTEDSTYRIVSYRFVSYRGVVDVVAVTVAVCAWLFHVLYVHICALFLVNQNMPTLHAYENWRPSLVSIRFDSINLSFFSVIFYEIYVSLRVMCVFWLQLKRSIR